MLLPQLQCEATIQKVQPVDVAKPSAINPMLDHCVSLLDFLFFLPPLAFLDFFLSGSFISPSSAALFTAELSAAAAFELSAEIRSATAEAASESSAGRFLFILAWIAAFARSFASCSFNLVSTSLLSPA